MFIRTAKLTKRSAVVVDATRQAPPVRIDDFSSILVTGSLSMVTAHPAWSLRLAKWLKTAVENEASVFGICYGHQILADAFGGVVGYHPKGAEIGTFTVRLNPGAHKHPLLKELPRQFPAHLAHSQSVLTAPKHTRVLARSDHDLHQILTYGEKTITCQFHPEFDSTVMEGFLSTVAGRRPKPPEPVLGLPVLETPQASSLIGRFIELTTQQAEEQKQKK
jgi:GMP synthase (glutamine-hydrolysing)